MIISGDRIKGGDVSRQNLLLMSVEIYANEETYQRTLAILKDSILKY